MHTHQVSDDKLAWGHAFTVLGVHHFMGGRWGSRVFSLVWHSGNVLGPGFPNMILIYLYTLMVSVHPSNCIERLFFSPRNNPCICLDCIGGSRQMVVFVGPARSSIILHLQNHLQNGVSQGKGPAWKTTVYIYNMSKHLRAGNSLMSTQAQERTRGNPEGEHHVPSLRLVIVWHLLACQNVYPFYSSISYFKCILPMAGRLCFVRVLSNG